MLGLTTTRRLREAEEKMVEEREHRWSLERQLYAEQCEAMTVKRRLGYVLRKCAKYRRNEALLLGFVGEQFINAAIFEVRRSAPGATDEP